MRRCLILYGLTCVIGQVLSVRELATAFHGNELVYGAVLAVWLLLFAVGSAGLGRLAGKYSLSVPAFALALAGGGALVPATVLLARTSRYFLFGSSGIAPSLGGVLLATFITLAPLCLVLGFFYALACSIVSRLEESAASAATRVYLGEAIGTFLGGILLTYVLLQAMGAFQIALILAAVDCLAGFAVWRHSSRAAEKRGWALLAGCAPVLRDGVLGAEPVGRAVLRRSAASWTSSRSLRASRAGCCCTRRTRFTAAWTWPRTTGRRSSTRAARWWGRRTWTARRKRRRSWPRSRIPRRGGC